jgi:hypothetical protein
MMSDKPKSKKNEWIEEYSCGCSSSTSTRRELLGYCKKHGASRKNIYRIVYKQKGDTDENPSRTSSLSTVVVSQ